MSMDVGHLLQWAETVYIPKALTAEELSAVKKELESKLTGEELAAAISELESYNSNLKNAYSAYLAAEFTAVAADPEMPGYRVFVRNDK